MDSDADLTEVIRKNLNVYRQEATNFHRVFGQPLSWYWDGNLMGFDILKFDDQIVQSLPDVSMKDTIQEKYGDEGIRIINALLFVEK